MSEREREIARLGLNYGAIGWKPLEPGHKPGVIDPVRSIILEVNETHRPVPVPEEVAEVRARNQELLATVARLEADLEWCRNDRKLLLDAEDVCHRDHAVERVVGRSVHSFVDEAVKLARLTPTSAEEIVARAVHGITTYVAQDAIDQARGLDTDRRVRFYEHDFYPLSNFSAFSVLWRGQRYDTSEHAYHCAKFAEVWRRDQIADATSAHEAFKLAESWREHVIPAWKSVRVDIMREILLAKVEQHEYVKRKLLATGDRELVEDSWRDDFWGWGPNRDGANMLGKLWMELRAELRGGERE